MIKELKKLDHTISDDLLGRLMSNKDYIRSLFFYSYYNIHVLS